MKTIERKQYLNKLKVLKDKNLIKVATGLRRFGKSTLMFQFQERKLQFFKTQRFLKLFLYF